MAVVLMKKPKVIGVQITNFKRDGNAIVTNVYSKVSFDVNTIPPYNTKKDYEEEIYDPVRSIQQVGFFEEGTQMSVIGVVGNVKTWNDSPKRTFVEMEEASDVRLQFWNERADLINDGHIGMKIKITDVKKCSERQIQKYGRGKQLVNATATTKVKVVKLPEIKKRVTVKGITNDKVEVVDELGKELLLDCPEDLQDEVFESCGSEIELVLKDGKEIISVSQ